MLWDVTRFVLADVAQFDPSDLTFNLQHSPVTAAPTGRYTLPRRDEIGHHYRLQHPLAQHVMEAASETETTSKPVELAFDYSGTPRNISVLESLVGESGTLSIRRLTITSLDSEDHFLFAGITDAGDKLTAEQVRRLFNLLATESTPPPPRPTSEPTARAAGAANPTRSVSEGLL